MKPFSGQALADFASPFAESVGLGDNLPVTEAFDNYASSKTRISSADKFTSAKFEGESLAKKLAVTKDTPPGLVDNIKLVRTELNAALKLSDDTEKAQNRYKEDIKDLEMCIRRPDFNYLPASLIDYMFSIRGEAVESIKTQHAAELANLEALFSKTTYRDALVTSLGLDELQPAEQKKQLDAVKKSMVDELNASHAKQITDFETSINKPIKDTLSSSKARVAFLAMIDQVENNKAAIQSLVAAAKGDLAAQTVQNADATQAQLQSKRYKNVNVKDLTTIFTATGIKINKAEGNENAYTVALPNRILSPFFYRSSEHNLKRTFMTALLALRARDMDMVEITINHPDPVYRKELCRTAMEAAIEAGFEPKNIKIMSGEEVYAEEKPGDIKTKLFADCPSRYDASVVEAEKNNKDWEEALKETQANSSPDSFKAELAKTVAIAKAEELEREKLESGGGDLNPASPAAAKQ